MYATADGEQREKTAILAGGAAFKWLFAFEHLSTEQSKTCWVFGCHIDSQFGRIATPPALGKCQAQIVCVRLESQQRIFIYNKVMRACAMNSHSLWHIHLEIKSVRFELFVRFNFRIVRNLSIETHSGRYWMRDRFSIASIIGSSRRWNCVNCSEIESREDDEKKHK